MFKTRAIMLPAAILAAMFSLMIATIVISLAGQSHDFIQGSESNLQKQLQAQAEVNRLLARLSTGEAIEPLIEEPLSQTEDDISWRVWVEREPESEEIFHLHAEVWETSKGPPGQRASRVVHVYPPKQQVQFLQSTSSTGFGLHYRNAGENNWNSIPSTFTQETGRMKYYESTAADDLGGLFVAERDEVPPLYNDAQYQFRRFDTETGNWSTLPLPSGNEVASVSFGNGQVAALTSSGNGPPGQFDRVSVFNTETDTWTSLPPPPNRVYDRSGQLQTVPPGSFRGHELDIDQAGNIYFRPYAHSDSGVSDDETTVHLWDGEGWSTLPPFPASFLPDRPPIAYRPPHVRVNKQMTVTGEGQVAMAWTAAAPLNSGFGINSGTEMVEYQIEHGTIVADTRLAEFDGDSWSALPLPTMGTLYGEDYFTPSPYGVGYGNTDPEPQDLNAPVNHFPYLDSNREGEVYINNNVRVATLEEGDYGVLDLPEGHNPVNLSSGSRPIDGPPQFETVVSF